MRDTCPGNRYIIKHDLFLTAVNNKVHCINK